MSDDTPSPLNNVITIDNERIKSHLDRVVRGTVEETLNALLDAEADRMCNAQRYERSAARRDTRAGHYERGLQTKAGEVRLRVPKLRQQTFETAIIERYRRRESSVEEALIEMYLAGVSVRRVEDITEALWGTRVPAKDSPVGLGPHEDQDPLCLPPRHLGRHRRQHRRARRWRGRLRGGRGDLPGSGGALASGAHTETSRCANRA
jgi:hypothetical protein